MSAALRPATCSVRMQAAVWLAPTGDQLRLGGAAVVDRQRAARRERAAGRQARPATAAHRESAPAARPAGRRAGAPSRAARRCRASGGRGRAAPTEADLDGATGVHHHGAVGELGDHPEVVGDDQHARAGDVACGLQHLEDLRLHGDVQRGGRLVADEQVGVVGDRDGDDDPLALAAGELVRERPRALFGLGDADEVEQFDRSGARRPARGARRCAPRWPRRSGRRRCRRGSAPTSGPGTPCRWPCPGPGTSVGRTGRAARRRAAGPIRSPRRTPAAGRRRPSRWPTCPRRIRRRARRLRPRRRGSSSRARPRPARFRWGR